MFISNSSNDRRRGFRFQINLKKGDIRSLQVDAEADEGAQVPVERAGQGRLPGLPPQGLHLQGRRDRGRLRQPGGRRGRGCRGREEAADREADEEAEEEDHGGEEEGKEGQNRIIKGQRRRGRGLSVAR